MAAVIRFRFMGILMISCCVSIGLTLGSASARLGSDDVTIPACPAASCAGHCGRTRHGYCFCDELCLQYADCCPDYLQHCSPDAVTHGNQTKMDALDLLVTLTQNASDFRKPLQCQQIPPKNHFLVVSKCPDFYNESDIVKLCEFDSGEFAVPLLYSGRMYKNVACLECNVPAVNESLITFPEVKFQCINNTIQAETFKLYADHGTTNELVRFMSKHCRVKVNTLDYALDVTFTAHLAYCNIIDSCNASKFFGEEVDFIRASELCQAYRDPLMLEFPDWSYVTFKNAHCAYCNGYLEQLPDMICFDWNSVMSQFDPWQFLPSFKILFDVNGRPKDRLEYATHKVCPNGNKLELDSDTCLQTTELSCGNNSFVKLDNHCLNINESITIPQPTNTFPTPVQYLISLHGNVSIDELDELAIVLINASEGFSSKALVPECQQKLPWLHDKGFSKADDVVMNMTCVIFEHPTLMYGGIRRRTVKSLTSGLSRYLSGAVKEAIAVGGNDVTAKAYILPPAILQTKSLIVNCTSHAHVTVFTQDYKFLRQYGPTGSEEVAYKGYLFPAEVVPIGIRADYNKQTNLIDNGQVLAMFCALPIVSCTTRLVTSDLVRLDGDYLIYGDNMVGGGHFAQTESGDYLICDDVIQEEPLYDLDIVTQGYDDLLKPVYYSLTFKVQSALTLAGNIISPLFLLVTIATYIILKPLRTVPGVGILNLSIALLGAQVLFHLNKLLPPWPIACSLLAMTQHYFWLVAFTWMTTMAAISYRIFTRRLTIPACTNSYNMAALILSVWLTPAVFIAGTVCVDLFTNLDINYGGPVDCWIQGFDGMVYFFIAPLALLILINGFLFAGTAHALRMTMNDAEPATSDKAEHRSLFLIVVKLSTVMGFTWVFGFLANSPSLHYFWYPFIVLNTLQGVFICSAFILNRRVLQLYRERLGCVSESAHRGEETPDLSKQKDTSSTLASDSSNRMSQ